MFCGFLDIFEHFAVFRKSPQNLCIVFKQRSESPQISAILRKTCAKNAETQLKKSVREISHQAGQTERFVLVISLAEDKGLSGDRHLVTRKLQDSPIFEFRQN